MKLLAKWEAARDAFPGNFRMKLSIKHDAGTCLNNNLSFTHSYEQDAKHFDHEMGVDSIPIFLHFLVVSQYMHVGNWWVTIVSQFYLSLSPYSNRRETWEPLKTVENCCKVRHGKRIRAVECNCGLYNTYLLWWERWSAVHLYPETMK